MRIPLTKVYRGFRELDRFSDEQCERFVKTACRRGWRRHVHRASMVVAAVIVGLMAMVGVAVASSLVEPGTSRSEEALIIIPTILVLCGLPALVMLVIKDFLLIRRIRFVLLTRGSCPSCNYSLVGVPISEDYAVICPECGFGSQVDPALSELSSHGDGQTAISPAAFDPTPGFWTSSRRTTARRLAIGAGVICFGLIPLSWGGYELFLRSQASQAAADRVSVEQLLELVDANQPPHAGPTSANAWAMFDQILIAQGQVEQAVSLPYQPPSAVISRPPFADYELIGRPFSDPEDRRRTRFERLCREIALDCLEEFESAGVYDLMAEMRASPRAVRQFALAPGEPLVLMQLPELTQARRLAQINRARMHVALERSDLDTFADALENTLALARMCEAQPWLLHGLVAAAIESTAHTEVLRAMQSRPSIEWLDAIEGAIARQRSHVPREYHLHGERLMTLDAVAWVFSDVSNVRFGRFSSVAGVGAGGFDIGAGRLGSYAQNKRIITTFYDRAASHAALEPWERLSSGVSMPFENLVLVDYLLPAINNAIGVRDTAIARRVGLDVRIALERYRVEHGEYPSALAAVVPGQMQSMPVDPFSGSDFVYRRLDPAIDPERREFVLYSTGPDGADNGGARPDDGENPLRPQPGEDLMLSDRP